MAGLRDIVYIPKSYDDNNDTSRNCQQLKVCKSLPQESDQIPNEVPSTVKITGLGRGNKGLQYVPDSILCNLCWKYIKTEALPDHIAARHIGQTRQHMCKDCGKSYKFGSTLANHRAKHHGDTSPDSSEHRNQVKAKIACSICQKTFDFQCRLVQHMMGHRKTWSFVYRCVVCLEQFDSVNGLQDHAESHTDDMLDCALCGMQLKGTDDILRHTQDHKEQEQTPLSENTTKENDEARDKQDSINIDQQEAISSDKQDAINSDKQDAINSDKHYSINRDRLTCDVCGKLFHFASSLISHMKLHKASQSLKCHRCFQMYNGIKALRLHLKSCDAPDPEADPPGVIPKRKRHRCDICHEKFLTYHGSQSHRLIHTGEPKAHQCPVCGKRFVLRGHLKKHSTCHMEFSPHVCEFCGRRFARQEGLRFHRMIHTGERPCLCDICGKGFVSGEKLRLHKFVHSRETPFNCKVCGRGFRAFVTRQKHKCEGPPSQAATEPQQTVNIDAESDSLLDPLLMKEMYQELG